MEVEIRNKDQKCIIAAEYDFLELFPPARLDWLSEGEHFMKSRISALKSASLLTAGAVFWIGSAVAAPLSYPSNSGELFDAAMRGGAAVERTETESGPAPDLKRQVVSYSGQGAAGTVIIDTANTYLYFIIGDGKAIRYGIGVGRDGFTWSGAQPVTRKAEWPDWTPPQEMLARQPYLARWMAGGEGNPLGARAIYLGNTFTASTAPTCRRRLARRSRAAVSEC